MTSPQAPARFGRYTIERLLGRGGMGEVYLARQVDLDRQVALKVLNAELARDAEAVARLHREARSVARIDSTSVVRVFDTGIENGVPFIAMEYVSGVSASALLQKKGGKLPPREATKLAIGAALGLKVAHAAGVLHRDVKPANILVSAEGRVKLADFGLAKLHQRSPVGPEGPLSVTGQILGTPDYMAPEQADDRELDARADLYSLGVTYYELLTGVRPFHRATTFGTLAQVLTGAIVPPRQHVPEVPEGMERACLALMARDREARPASAEAAIALLQGTLAGTVGTGSSSRVVVPRSESQKLPAKTGAPEPSPARSTGLVLGGAAALLVAAGAAVLVVRSLQGSDEAAREKVALLEQKAREAETKASAAQAALLAEKKSRQDERRQDEERRAEEEKSAPPVPGPPADPPAPPPPREDARPAPAPDDASVARSAEEEKVRRRAAEERSAREALARAEAQRAEEARRREGEEARKREGEERAFQAEVSATLPRLRAALAERRAADAAQLADGLEARKLPGNGDADDLVAWAHELAGRIKLLQEHTNKDLPLDLALKALAVTSWRSKTPLPADLRAAATLAGAALDLPVPSPLFTSDASLQATCKRLSLAPRSGDSVGSAADVEKLPLLGSEREQWLRALEKVEPREKDHAKAELEALAGIRKLAQEARTLLAKRDIEGALQWKETAPKAIAKLTSRCPARFLASGDTKAQLELLCRVPDQMSALREACLTALMPNRAAGTRSGPVDEKYSRCRFNEVAAFVAASKALDDDLRFAAMVSAAAEGEKLIGRALYRDPAGGNGEVKKLLDLLQLDAPAPF